MAKIVPAGGKVRFVGRFLVGIAISTALTALAFRKLDVHAVWAVLSKANRGLAAIAVLLLLSGFVLRAFRWYCILRKAGSRAPFITVMKAILAGFSINNLLPLRAGDLVRAFAFTDRLDCRKTTLAGSLVVERVLDLLSLLVIGIFVLHCSSIPANLRPAQVTFTLLAAFGIVAIFAVLLWVARLGELAIRTISKMPCQAPVREKLHGYVAVLVEFIATIGPATAAQLGALSLLIWFIEGTVYICCALAVSASNIAVGPWLAMVLANFSMLIPSGPGYVGTFHVSASTGLVLNGVSTCTAAAFAILVHAVLWVPITVLGLACFASLTRNRKRRAAKDVQAAEAPAFFGLHGRDRGLEQQRH